MILDPLGVLVGGSEGFNGFWKLQMFILMDFGIFLGPCGGESGRQELPLEQPSFVRNGIFPGFMNNAGCVPETLFPGCGDITWDRNHGMLPIYPPFLIPSRKCWAANSYEASLPKKCPRAWIKGWN